MNALFVQKPNAMLSLVKLVLWLSVIGSLLTFPDVIVHFIAVVAHTLYESAAFLLEEFLRHNFGLSKNASQLIVFYLSISLGIWFLVLLWRQMPIIINWLKDYLVYQIYIIRLKLVYTWHSLRADQKIKVILIQSVVTLSAVMFLLT